MDYDGFNLAETDAICHYVAKKHNLAGKDLQEEATCMMVANMINGYLTKIAKVTFEKDEKKKEELRKDLKEKDAPQFFGTIVKMLTKNGGKHLVGNKVCLDCLWQESGSLNTLNVKCSMTLITQTCLKSVRGTSVFALCSFHMNN